MDIKEFTDFYTDPETGQPLRNKAIQIDSRVDARAIVVKFKKQIYNMDKSKWLNKKDDEISYVLHGTEFEAWYNMEIKVQVNGEWVTVKLGDFLLDSVHPRSLREVGIQED